VSAGHRSTPSRYRRLRAAHDWTSLNMWTEQLSINLLSARRLAVLSITYFGCDFGQIDVKMLDAVARLVEARP
jgi:hypothetical protein